MEPRIQYAKTSDGVSIAFWTLGEGMPLVQAPFLGWSHIQMEWQNPILRSLYERHAERGRRLVRYDSRGSGLSERDVTGLSLDSFVLDLEAVVDRLGLERFAVLGSLWTGPVAIAYAARHPERVSHLMLWCTWARKPELPAQYAAALSLRDKDWELYTETAFHAAFGWEKGEQAHQWAAMMRESITEDRHDQFLDTLMGFDVSDLLPDIRSPTLVLHRREIRWPSLDVAMGLASKVPDARLAVLEGDSAALGMGDVEAVFSAIGGFLGEGDEAAEAPKVGEGLQTILFTDVEGSTALTQRLGDARARDLLREHERLVREALKAHGGSEVKTMGDGFMASFGSATRALKCAIAMQWAFAQHNESAQEPIRVRIGLNAGEPIAEDHDLFGTAVNRAARITARAKGGEILVSNVVRELAEGKDFLFADRGEASLKGFDEPVRLYEVRWEKDA